MIVLRIAVAICLLTLCGVVHAQFTTVINVPPDVAPDSIGSDTQLNLMDGGMLTGMPANPDDPSSLAIFEAGSPDGSSQNVELNISGGEAQYLDIYAGAVLNMSRGIIEDFIAYEGATLNITGGTVRSDAAAQEGSTVNISGGIFSGPLSIAGPFDASLSGGAFGEIRYGGISFNSNDVGTLTLVGNEFLVNGATAPDSALLVNVTVTGVFASGLPFIVQHSGDIEFESVPVPPIQTTSILVDSGVGPYGIRFGQTVTVVEGGRLPAPFTAVGATVNLEGGESDSVYVADSDVRLAGGSIRLAQLWQGSKLTISAGSIDRVNSNSESHIVMTSGKVGDVRLFGGSSMLLSGGTAGLDSGETFDVQSGSELEIIGTQFLLGGSPIPGLSEPGDSVLLFTRGGSLLSGSLADGSFFSLRLNEGRLSGQDRIERNAKLRITLVPEPTALGLVFIALSFIPVRRYA